MESAILGTMIAATDLSITVTEGALAALKSIPSHVDTIMGAPVGAVAQRTGIASVLMGSGSDNSGSGFTPQI